MRGSKATGVPFKASSDSAPVMSATFANRSAASKARPPTEVIACVPLSSASPSLASSTSGAMRAHEVDLQFAQVVLRNRHVGEFAEACVDAIDDFAALDDLFDEAASPFDAGPRPFSKRDRYAVSHACGSFKCQ